MLKAYTAPSNNYAAFNGTERVSTLYRERYEAQCEAEHMNIQWLKSLPADQPITALPYYVQAVH